LQDLFELSQIFLLGRSEAEVEGEIDGWGGVRDGTDGDEMHAGFGDLADGLKVHASACFELNFFGTEANSLVHVLMGHVVEKYDIHSLQAEKTFGLLECVGLEFDADAGIGCACGGDHVLQVFEIKSCREVIVLNHEHIMEADPVVAGAACGDSGFFQEAQAWSGFAGIEYDGISPANSFDKSTSHGGNTAETLDEIQGGALGGEDRGCSSFDSYDDIAFFQGGAVRQFDLNLKCGIDTVENLRSDLSAGKTGWFAGDDFRRSLRAGEGEPFCSDIPRPDILGEGEVYDVGNVRWRLHGVGKTEKSG
jgi:hypothetical protein